MEGGAGVAPDPSPALTLLEEQFEDVLESVNNIFVAAGDGELGKVQAFVASGVSVNSADEYGYTPLCVWSTCSPAHAVPPIGI